MKTKDMVESKKDYSKSSLKEKLIGIVYFTRGGSTKDLANKIAKKTKYDLIQVTDDKSWKGFIGILRGGIYGAMKKQVNINLHFPEGKNLNMYDEFIVVSPIWVERLAPAICEFVKSVDKQKLTILTNGVHKNLGRIKTNFENEFGSAKEIINFIQGKTDEKEAINQVINIASKD